MKQACECFPSIMESMKIYFHQEFNIKTFFEAYFERFRYFFM